MRIRSVYYIFNNVIDDVNKLILFILKQFKSDLGFKIDLADFQNTLKHFAFIISKKVFRI